MARVLRQKREVYAIRGSENHSHNFFGASPQESIAALEWAHGQNFQTSVGMEPMLGSNEDMIGLVAAVERFVTDKIWPRKLNGVVVMQDRLAGVAVLPQALHGPLPGCQLLLGKPRVPATLLFRALLSVKVFPPLVPSIWSNRTVWAPALPVVTTLVVL